MSQPALTSLRIPINQFSSLKVMTRKSDNRRHQMINALSELLFVPPKSLFFSFVVLFIQGLRPVYQVTLHLHSHSQHAIFTCCCCSSLSFANDSSGWYMKNRLRHECQGCAAFIGKIRESKFFVCFFSWCIFESTAITLAGVRVEGKLFFFCLWLNLKRSAFLYFGEHGKFWELGIF